MGSKSELGEPIRVYTDGSCHPQSGSGGWAAIVLADGEKIELTGTGSGTNHQRMELMAALEAIRHLQRNKFCHRKILLYTDSQYLVGLSRRQERLVLREFSTRKNKPVRNTDLILPLLEYLDTLSLELIKVSAHEKASDSENFNRTVDKTARKIVRREVQNAGKLENL